MNLASLNLDMNDIKVPKVKKVSERDIAIIGISLNLPLANTQEEFWRILDNKIDCIREFPASRKKDSDLVLSYLHTFNPTGNVGYCDAGYIDDIDKFDADFFHIPPAEAKLMDPNQRLFLTGAWEAIEDAGYGGEKLKGTNTGVYVGYTGWPVYGQLISQTQSSPAPQLITGNMNSIIASRISYLLDLKGPSLLVDTACSSSLVAIHLASQAIRNGECDMALAGGIKISLFHMINRRENGVNIDSSDFRTRSFSADSDGTGWGEGVVVFVLKSLAGAMNDKDHIYAVIKGTAVNQDGSSIGITAPNIQAQEEVIVKAWTDGGVDPVSIGYMEAHGTGTALGDPMEIEGITRAFRNFTTRTQFCAIGSVKSNIGHLDNAAGAAGLLKAVLALKHKVIPPSIHFKRPNKKIAFEESPVYVNDTSQVWEKEDHLPRRCGVSSFGLSGVNCHIVIEEAPEIEHNVSAKNLNLLSLSAASRQQLLQLVRRYIHTLQNLEEQAVSDLCYTANCGRGQYAFRLAAIGEDKQSLLSKLEAFAAGEPENNLFVSGEAVPSSGANESDKQARLADLARQFVEGSPLDWAILYRGEERCTISLPTYPFERKRHWLDIPFNGAVDHETTSSACGEAEKTGWLRRNNERSETVIARICADVLGYTEVDVNQSFYDLGGDSLSAVVAVSQIQKLLDRGVTLTRFLASPSLKELGDSISFGHSAGNRSIEVQPAREHYAVSSSQKRVYISSVLDNGGIVYNQPNAFFVMGDIELEKVKQCLGSLIARHESLRTGFEDINGEIVQKIYDQVHPEIEYYADHEFDPESFMKRFIRPFQLNHAPLFRVAVIKLDTSKYFFAYDIHHIIADGKSLNIVINDFFRLYAGENLGPLRLQYKDFSMWQNARDEMASAKEFWLSEFNSSYKAFDLPIDYPRPKRQVLKGSLVEFEIGADTYNRLSQLCGEMGSTFFMLFYSLFSILLSRFCERDDIIIGSPVSGREDSELENVVGMFVNTVAIRSQPYNDMRVKDFIEEVKVKVIAVLENQNYPFDRLLEELNVAADSSRHPLFDALLVYDSEVKNIVNSNMEREPYHLHEKSTNFDLTLHIVSSEGRFTGEFIYCAALFSQTTIETISKCFLNLIKEILKDPYVKIGEVNFLATDNEYDDKDEIDSLEADFSF